MSHKPIDEFEGCQRGFQHYARSYYARPGVLFPEETDYVSFGLYDPEDGGSAGTVTMTWIELGSTFPSPRLQAFNDSWKVLARCTDVIAAIEKFDDQNIQPEAFCQLLLHLGFRDFTRTEDDDEDSSPQGQAYKAAKTIFKHHAAEHPSGYFVHKSDVPKLLSAIAELVVEGKEAEGS